MRAEEAGAFLKGRMKSIAQKADAGSIPDQIEMWYFARKVLGLNATQIGETGFWKDFLVPICQKIDSPEFMQLLSEIQ